MPQWTEEVLRTNVLAEHLPPLSRHEALVESNRCLFCYDAPCTHACPTHIDIPRFIKKISTGNVIGSAKTILEANLLGATCARVCPVQELCEGACVLGSEHKPIAIGRLQRYAMDDFYQCNALPFQQAPSTGRKVAVIGAGPAGLSCAGELARRGHAVTIFERRNLPGGLSTFGIISLREPIEIALAEVEMLKRVGIQLHLDTELCRDVKLPELQNEFDAIFLSAGQGQTPRLNIPGEEHIVDGLAFIEASKLNPHAMQLGRQVLVIGAGNTAIDCATIAKRMGAPRVTILYRRSEAEMSAYRHEYEFARNEGIEFRFYTQPIRLLTEGDHVAGLECVAMLPGVQPVDGSEFILPADQVVKAIGQEKPSLASLLGLRTTAGFIDVNANFETSAPGVFAGGDGVRSKGDCSTVMAVEDGKLAAIAIDEKLKQGAKHG